MDTTNGGGWESLSEDIFILIVEKIPTLEDSIRVSFVCKSWKSMSDSAILHRFEKKNNLPLLIVPPYNHKGVGGVGCGSSNVWDDTLGFISLFDGDDDDDDDDDEEVNKKMKKKEGVYKLHLPEIANRRICGSSEGWLITVHENTEVQLLNPISKVLVHLPPLLTAFPEVVGKVVLEKEICYLFLAPLSFQGYDSQYFRDFFFTKVVTNATSTTTTIGVPTEAPLSFQGYDSQYFRDFFFTKVVTNATSTTTTIGVPTEVMAIYGSSRTLAFCRPSSSSSSSTGNGIDDDDDDDEQNKWICCCLENIACCCYEDVTFYKGNFYAVDSFGCVVVVKGLDGPSPPFLEKIIIQPDTECYSRINYLVESSSFSSGCGGGGDLLKVARDIETERENKKEEEFPYRTIGFRVWKLDFNDNNSSKLMQFPSWEKVTDLGEDCALFIGYNHSFSFSASKFSGCKGNCIYFTDNNLSKLYKFGGHDMGVYNLEDGSVEKLNYETTSFMPPSFWYVPRASTSLPALSNNNCVEKQREMKKQQGLFKEFSQTPTPTPTSSTSYIPPFCSATTTTTTNTSFARLLEKKLPLLIVPYNHKGGGGGGGSKKERKLGSSSSSSTVVCADTLGFISLFHSGNHDDDELRNKEEEEEIYKVYLPELEDRRICGSSEGWLITVHENSEVQLLNPISKVLVHLPPLTTFPGVGGTFISEEIVGELVPKDSRGLCYLVKEDRPPRSPSGPYVVYGSHCFRESFFSKVVTNTTDANSTVPTVVMAIYRYGLAFCRPSGNGIDDAEQNKWICCLEEKQKQAGDYDDVTFYKGNFYAVCSYGHVVVVKGLDGPSPFVESIIERETEYYSPLHYLVDSSSSSGGGDLLKVRRNVESVEENEEVPYITIGFRVWKLDFNGPSWEKVTNLGEDRALFVGYNRSFSFSASKIPGCRGNCIYFTDNNESLVYDNKRYGGHDMGVYNLEDGSIEKLNYETLPFMPPPIWYVPNTN